MSYTGSRRLPALAMLVLAGLYAAQSITGSMVQTALPVVLRDSGLGLDQIGYLSALFLPWALKFLWAPLVDRFFTQRAWILSCQVGLIATFLLASTLPPATSLSALTAVLLAMAMIAATQDVATDSLGVHATTADDRATASGASTFGGYLGFLVGAGLWLPIYAAFGWRVSMLSMAGWIVVLTVPTLLAGRLGQRRQNSAGRERPSFRAAFANRQLVTGLGFLIVYQTGIRLAVSMTGPLMVDAGLSVSTIGWIKGAGGALAGIVAALVGATLTQWLGVRRGLQLIGAVNMLICISLAVIMSAVAPSRMLVIVAELLLAAGVAMSFVALYAAMMNWCSQQQVATDFAILQSADAILAIVAGVAAGQLGQHAGYVAIFILSAVLLAIGIALVRILPVQLPAGSVEEQAAALPILPTNDLKQESYP